MDDLRTRALLGAIEYLELPYLWGGDGPGPVPSEGIDCSGLVISVFAGLGIFPSGFDDTAQGLFNRWRGKAVGEAQAGCLAFYGKDEASVTHVMLCVSPRAAIGAVGGFRQRVTSLPIKYRSDLIAIVDPFKEDV